MILFQPITEEQLPELIAFSYEGDTIGLNTYYGKSCTVDEATHLTMIDIAQFECNYELQYYSVKFSEETIGYIITSDTLLYSFCIKKYYRTPLVLRIWWLAIMAKIGNTMTCILPSNNIRAINFVKRRGMKVIDQKPGTILFSY